MITEETAVTDAAPKPEPSKSDTVKKLLSRKSGATIEELGAATNWQPHSTRAFISGLRKKGVTVEREERRDGAKAYRIAKAAEAAAKQ
jgi:hypothetical protein